MIDRAAIRALLGDGTTVVTPNRRLARDLKREFDRSQQDEGRTVWLTADVLPWSAWLVRSFDEVEPGAVRPTMLLPVQQQLLWRRIVGESPAGAGLPHADALAAVAEDAWTLLHDEGDLAELVRHAGNEDQVAFQGWARQFTRELRARRAISPAQLPDALGQALRNGTWRPSRRVAFAGFDRVSAQQRRLFSMLEQADLAVQVPSDPDRGAADVVRIDCTDARSQWTQVATWARARLQANPDARIGIVVPDLGNCREAVVGALTDALAPALRVLPVQGARRPFNLSLGRPLAQTPLVETALGLFELMCGPLPSARASALLRSPFIAAGAAGETEWAPRARIDRALRDDGAWQLTLERLRRAGGRLDAAGLPHADSTPLLAAGLARVAQRLAPVRRRRLALPVWVTLLFGSLQDVGFPGTRALDSVEYQTYQRLRESIAQLGSLDELAGPVGLADAVALLRRMAADTLFQAEAPEVPVQVLGVLESAQLRFDHLWIANVSEEQWPPQPQPNPLLPLGLQRAWQLPGASAELALARALRQMQYWASATTELIYSHAALDGDRPVLPSPLTAAIAAMPFEALVQAAVEPVAAKLARGIALSPVIDQQAPAFEAASALPVRGGTRIFADQSACAFRAFASHRLHAGELAAPEPGLDAAARGRLLHDTLAAFWADLGSQEGLRKLDDAALHARVLAAARSALDRLADERPDLMGPRLRELEGERLARAVHGWLDIEDARPPFSVVTVESQGEVEIGGLRVTVRPDRVDRLADGSLAIIDYKTGRVSAQAWLDERPEQPQLPLYATAYATGAMHAGPQPVGAIAFGQLRPGETRIVAVAAREDLLPGARVIAADEVAIAQPGWEGLLDDWRDVLERLAQQFVRGDAAVAPKAVSLTCRHCPLSALCRRHERASPEDRFAEDARAGGEGE